MKRKDFLNGCSACGAVALFDLFHLDKLSGEGKSLIQEGPSDIPVNRDQIIKLLQFIDTSVDEPSKEKIFNKLGTECLYSRGYNKWVLGFKDNQDEFFARVQRGQSTFWEKLEYDKEKSVITLVGKVVKSCACDYSKSDPPPKALCNYCCKKFQEEMFSLLLGKKAKVRIDESFLLGGERCSTTIFIS